jgi:ribonucleoside-diphosphate reductase alpha chain
MGEHEVYREHELRDEGLKYFKGDILATNVWINKYALKNKDGYYEELTPNDTIQRVAKEIYREELKHSNPLSYEEIYNTLDKFQYFIFGGSILFGIGNNNAVSSLGNCFFIDNGSDSYGGIFNIDESMVQLMKRRGGVGITIEHLRPSTSAVNNSARSSTGAVSFMNRFSNSTREVAQDGRRGALMITMHINHPDITDFVIAKDDLTKITGANISVKVTDEFMRAVENDEDYILSWPTTSKQLKIEEQLPYNKLVKVDKEVPDSDCIKTPLYVKRVKAKDLWNIIVKQAHKSAEPGVLFWDSVIKESPADEYKDLGFETKGTNPCGEVPLSPYDSCRLGSINLFNMVDKPFTRRARFNWDRLAHIARLSQRFMDDIVGLEEEKVMAIIKKIKNDPEPPEIKRAELQTWNKVLKVLRNGRRTGIGVLGEGDMFASLGIQYGTSKATKLAEDIQKCIAINSYRESIKLAKERGAFPIWDADIEAGNPFLRRVISENFDHQEYNEYLKVGRRNIATMSIAPTGSLAILAQTTSGIEPVFKIYYRRRRKVNPGEEEVKIAYVDDNGDSWEEYNVLHYPFIKWYCSQVNGDPDFKACHERLKQMSEEDLDSLISQSPWGGSESHAIDYIEKITMQGAIQKWVDHSISVTHNLPEKISIEEVNKIYFHGWKAGCKGLTIYREGSRSGVLLSTKEENTDFKETTAPKRPRILEADYYVAKALGREFAVIIGLWPNSDKPYEVFAFENPPMKKNTRGKIIKVRKGHYKFVNGEFEIEDIQLAADRVEQRMLTLSASMLLRHGAPIKHVIHIIKKIDENITSFSSVVRRYLARYIEEELNGESCPHCGDKLIMQDGCVKCVNPECGYSRCG